MLVEMPMRKTTIRLSDELYAKIAAEAERAGVTAAQWVRECITFRLGALLRERGELDELDQYLRQLDDPG